MFPALTCCGCRSQRQITTYIKHHKDCKCCSVAFFIFIVQPGFDVLECQKCQHDMLCCKIDIVLRKCLCERRAKQRRHVCALLERELRVQPAMRIQLLASLAVLSTPLNFQDILLQSLLFAKQGRGVQLVSHSIQLYSLFKSVQGASK